MIGAQRAILRAELSRDEGRRRAAYADSLGFWTIGVGRLIDARKGGRLREIEIDFLLDNDIAECEADCSTMPWFAGLDAVRQRVVLNMRFQLGSSGLRKFRNTLAAVARGDYAAAAAGMSASLWATQTPARANRLIAMMRSGAEP